MCTCASSEQEHEHLPHQAMVQNRQGSSGSTPYPHPQTARSPIRHWLCPHPVHTASAPAAQPGLRDGQLYSAPSPGAGAWLDPGSQDPSSPETKSYQSGGAASLEEFTPRAEGFR